MADEKKGGYGGRPRWQWWLLYIVVGAILYYVIYLLFFQHTGSAGVSY
jgi:hypothetical protein